MDIENDWFGPDVGTVAAADAEENGEGNTRGATVVHGCGDAAPCAVGGGVGVGVRYGAKFGAVVAKGTGKVTVGAGNNVEVSSWISCRKRCSLDGVLSASLALELAQA